MSAFLGPIHYWLYNKIQLQQALVDMLYRLGEQNNLAIREECEKNFGTFENKPLEEMIDHGNIHGWLQERVSQVEYKYAYAVTVILESIDNSKEKLLNILSEYGKQLATDLKASGNEVTKATDLYKLIGDYLLDGMPCDHANRLISGSDTEVIWTRTLCVHSRYWDEVEGDIKVYYELRDAWMNGFVTEFGYLYEKQDETTFIIKTK